MGVFDFVKNGVREMMIARPDNLKHLIVYKHPDQNVPMYSQLTVDSDECAVFFKDGKVVGVLPPGRHTLQTQNIPFLNNLVNKFTGGNVFIAEIFFVKTSPVRSIPFGGPIGDMIDPLTGEQVIAAHLRRVLARRDRSGALHHRLLRPGRAGRQRPDPPLGEGPLHERREDDARRALRGRGQERAPGRGADARSSRTRSSRTRPTSTRSACASSRWGSSTSTSPRRTAAASSRRTPRSRRRNARREADRRRRRSADARKQFELDQKFGQDARYVQQLAGNYQNYAAGQAMIGAGQGMAAHGVGDGGVAGAGAQMAIGVGMANADGRRVQGPRHAPQCAAGAAGAAVHARRREVDVREVQHASARREVLRRVRRTARAGEEVLHRLRAEIAARRSSARTAAPQRPR